MQDAMFYTRHGNCFVGKVPVDTVPPPYVKLEQYAGMFAPTIHRKEGAIQYYEVYPIEGVNYDGFYTVR